MEEQIQQNLELRRKLHQLGQFHNKHISPLVNMTNSSEDISTQGNFPIVGCEGSPRCYKPFCKGTLLCLPLVGEEDHPRS